MITFLPEQFHNFPDVYSAEDTGLLAIGGNLQPATLLKAYASGIFPWYSEDDPICWFAPIERCVLFPAKIKISKSMQQLIKSNRFSMTKNQAFESVIAHCSNIQRKDQDGTWITDEIIEAYIQLHQLGHAHSYEVRLNGKLAGGLYGIQQGKVFCGESMFSLQPNSSKYALISLCNSEEFQLIDCQVPNSHLLSMGAEVISKSKFMFYLNKWEEENH